MPLGAAFVSTCSSDGRRGPTKLAEKE